MICGRCKKDLSADYFSRSARRGRQNWCKSCASAYSAERYARMRQRPLPASKICGHCSELLPLSTFSRHACSRDGLRELCRKCASISKRAQKYLLTNEEVLAYLAVPLCQNLKCQSPFLHDRDVQFDHDPATGRMRGVLCMRCNTAAGRGCRHHIQRLRGLADYLEHRIEQG